MVIATFLFFLVIDIFLPKVCFSGLITLLNFSVYLANSAVRNFKTIFSYTKTEK